MSTNISTGNNLQPISVANALIPAEGPRVVVILAPFSTSAQSFLVDFQQAMTKQQISVIQALYVNNIENTVVLKIKNNNTGQTIDFPASSQGYLPVLASNPASFTLTSAVSANTNCYVHFINVPVPALIWPTGSGGSSSTTANGVYNAAGVTLSDGATAPLQLDARGSLETIMLAANNVEYNQVAIGTSATRIISATAQPLNNKAFFLKNNSSQQVAIGDSAVTFSGVNGGLLMDPGDYIVFSEPSVNAALYGVVASGSGLVSFLATY